MVISLDGISDGGEPYTREELHLIREIKAQELIKEIQRKRELWRLACEYDQIPPKSSFVVFSNDNPFAKELNNAA